jgi:hypothetical protein
VTEDDEFQKLAKVITLQKPFGPPDSGQFTDSIDLLRVLYDPGNRIHKQSVSLGAPYVIGRKGAGKTAFVTAPKLNANSVAIELPSADLYQGVFGITRSLLGQGVAVFAEHSARLWRHVTWCAIVCRLAKDAEDAGTQEAEVVSAFAESLGSGAIPNDADEAVTLYLQRLRILMSESAPIGGLGELLNSVRGYNVSITQAIEAATSILARSPNRYVVIVDSLERYNGVLPSPAAHHEPERVSFEGLFRFIGGDGTMPNRPFDIRFAFPAELWSVLASVSANPIKDFDQRVIAQWSAKELITLMGTRLSIYLRLHFPDTRQPLSAGAFRPLSYEESRRIVEAALPKDVTNGLGEREDIVAYLLRHTQLLPRHLVTILNRVWEAQHAIDPSAPLPITQLAVVDGVRQGETEIANDIIAAYSMAHPHARLCCERLIPHLPLVFADGDLHREFNQNGIKRETGMEYRELQRSLIEIGCVGRVTETTQRYTIGEFEYTRPGSLHVGGGEKLCLHPIFAEVFGSRHCSARRNQLSETERATIRPIYPIGSDPNSATDYRDEH